MEESKSSVDSDDDDTIEFEIEVIQSSSSASLVDRSPMSSDEDDKDHDHLEQPSSNEQKSDGGQFSESITNHLPETNTSKTEEGANEELSLIVQKDGGKQETISETSQATEEPREQIELPQNQPEAKSEVSNVCDLEDEIRSAEPQGRSQTCEENEIRIAEELRQEPTNGRKEDEAEKLSDEKREEGPIERVIQDTSPCEQSENSSAVAQSPLLQEFKQQLVEFSDNLIERNFSVAENFSDEAINDSRVEDDKTGEDDIVPGIDIEKIQLTPDSDDTLPTETAIGATQTIKVNPEDIEPTPEHDSAIYQPEEHQGFLIKEPLVLDMMKFDYSQDLESIMIRERQHCEDPKTLSQTEKLSVAIEHDSCCLKSTEERVREAEHKVVKKSNPQLVEISIEKSACLEPASIREPSSAEDLEWEFDNEPEFEPRQVNLKRGQDPRLEYELGEELGRGRFGTVYRCTEISSGRKLAAKFVHMRRREDREDVEREVNIMSQLQHKRLLQLYDAFDDGQSEMCLITELVEGGELFERIVDDDFDLTEKKAAIFMRQICEGIEYMHKKQIVHLDMKPENILCLSRTGNRIKLIDFGLARQLDDKKPLRVMFGTPDFAAPEVLAYDVISLATDMWSVGVVCYVLLSGLLPFMGDNDMDTMANVTRAAYDFNDASFEPISDLAKDFIAKLLVREPSKRLRPEECLRHAWLQRGGSQLEASIRSRRESVIIAPTGPLDMIAAAAAVAAATAAAAAASLAGMTQQQSPLDSPNTPNFPSTAPSLDKRNLKKYVVRRKWHKTAHAIMALGRMGANLKGAFA